MSVIRALDVCATIRYHVALVVFIFHMSLKIRLSSEGHGTSCFVQWKRCICLREFGCGDLRMGLVMSSGARCVLDANPGDWDADVAYRS